MNETAIKSVILQYLRSLDGVFCYKNYGGGYAQGGIPDIVCVFKGNAVFFEVKTPSGRLTKLQKVTIARIQEAGGIAEVVRSLDEVKMIMEELQ